MIDNFHLKLIVCGLVAVCVVLLVIKRRDGLQYKLHEINSRVRERMGRPTTEVNSHFADDIESGLHSENFDILANNKDDSREGLDDEAKKMVRDIMVSENVSFDKARLIYTERMFGDNEIAPDGMPLDPKAVTFA
ncbi:hypothetical protein DAKH74_034500 [Maudiozyma humilis]|uniref:Uncharacterized protein n=1 Tax=Maudiozyma humilis TaxID=51915 RepID=A0AAV5RYY8_MAUHU|nr:hypothetical protein DAKH74_034500 [Kazachstania humilis]